jgi:hypothetical protein
VNTRIDGRHARRITSLCTNNKSRVERKRRHATRNVSENEVIADNLILHFHQDLLSVEIYEFFVYFFSNSNMLLLLVAVVSVISLSLLPMKICLTVIPSQLSYPGRTIRPVYGRLRLLYGPYYGRNIGHSLS